MKRKQDSTDSYVVIYCKRLCRCAYVFCMRTCEFTPSMRREVLKLPKDTLARWTLQPKALRAVVTIASGTVVLQEGGKETQGS